jgi:hypothetical protein
VIGGVSTPNQYWEQGFAEDYASSSSTILAKKGTQFSYNTSVLDTNDYDLVIIVEAL